MSDPRKSAHIPTDDTVSAWPAGLFMALQATIVVAFAQVYFSFHWTTDILVGASLGILIVMCTLHPLS